MANYELMQFRNADELVSHVAGLWLDEIETANRAGLNHCVMLSGGRITQKFFSIVVALAAARNTSFRNVHFFWADERCVSPDDIESNFKSAFDCLFNPLNIREQQIHRLEAEKPAATAIQKAQTDILKFTTASNNGVPVVDLVFLGMGEDGHVASLFQNAMDHIANCKEFFLFVPDSPKPPPQRISVNVNVIAAARTVWVLASGLGKEHALKESMDENGKTPLARVIRARAVTKIFTDF